jgi:hypothetical protein
MTEICNSISAEDSGNDLDWIMEVPLPISPPDNNPDMRIGMACLKYILKVKVRKVVETRKKPERREWEISGIWGISSINSSKSIPLSYNRYS